MEKSTESTDMSKNANFSTGSQWYEKKSFIFQFLPGLGVAVEIFMIGCCAIATLQIFDHSFII